VLRIEERVAPQTLQDIMNFMPAGAGPGNLPNTGAADQVGLWSLLVLAGICLLGGRRLRQRRV
jgi:LPXTG-motif cell wall-anchored protein